MTTTTGKTNTSPHSVRMAALNAAAEHQAKEGAALAADHGAAHAAAKTEPTAKTEEATR